MRIFRTLKRIIRILIVPLREWPLIVKESESISLIIKYYAWPLIVLGALIKAGNVFLKFTDEVNLIQFRIPFSLTVLLFNMVAPLFVIIVGGSLIKHLSKIMGASGQKNGAFRLLIYSYTPVFLVTMFINAEIQTQYLQYIGLISIYAAVLYWMGMGPVLQIPSERKFGLLIFSAMILSFLFFIMVFVSRISINLLYPEGVMLFL
jgi:hypothetical protein